MLSLLSLKSFLSVTSLFRTISSNISLTSYKETYIPAAIGLHFRNSLSSRVSIILVRCLFTLCYSVRIDADLVVLFLYVWLTSLVLVPQRRFPSDYLVDLYHGLQHQCVLQINKKKEHILSQKNQSTSP